MFPQDQQTKLSLAVLGCVCGTCAHLWWGNQHFEMKELGNIMQVVLVLKAQQNAKLGVMENQARHCVIGLEFLREPEAYFVTL